MMRVPKTGNLGPCELCGNRRGGNGLVEIEAHHICRRCAGLIVESAMHLNDLTSAEVHNAL